MLNRKTVTVALALAGALSAGAAQAGRVDWSVNINIPGAVYAEPVPVYHAPPPVYYQPAPVYYAPPPVYYRPAPVVVYRSREPAIVGGSWERHGRRDGHHHRHWREQRHDRHHHGGHHGDFRGHRGDRW